MANVVGGIVQWDLDVNDKGLTDGLSKARVLVNETAKDIKKSFEKIGDDLEKVGRDLTLRVTAPIVAGLGAATKAAIDYESAFAGVRKTVDASEAEFANLSQNIRDIAKATPVSANELARIGELAGQLGVRGVDNLTKFIDVIAKMSVTTNLTSEAAATSFARIANIMQLPIDRVDKMGSTVVDLGNKFATTESEIVSFAERIAGAGKIASLSTSDILAIGTAMSSVGVEAEAGGTAVQKVLITMVQAVSEGGNKLEEFAKTAGISSKEFQAMFQEDAMAAFTHFVEGLGKQGEGAFKTLEKLELQDQRLIRSFLSLANAGELLNDTYNVSAKAWMQNNALQEEAEKRFATTASQIQIAKNNLYDLGITVGSVLLPALNDLMKDITPVIQSFAKFADAHPNIIKVSTALLLLVASVGPLALMASNVIKVFSAFKLLGSVVSSLGLVSKSVSFLGSGLSFLAANPIVLIIGALVLLAVLIYKNWDKIVAATQFMVDRIKQSFEMWKAIFETVANFIGNIVNKISNYFTNVRDNVNNSLNTIRNYITDRFNSIVSFLSGIGGRIIDAIVKPFNEAKNKIQQIAQQIKDAANNINPFVRHSPSLVDNVVKGIGVIKDQYNSLKDIKIPNSVNLIPSMEDFAYSVPSMTSSSGNPSGISQKVDIHIDKIEREQDVYAMGRELAFRMGLAI